ncbi:HMG domain containing protein 3 [Dissostichus eleginoides]|uniref:HMG domain containing protein 3 n=1 Tax=Dissostichus eleginoides TaxID=100907 RepID=A0AAD9CCY2_DISEL|nr:HMG domain containing protein 3 [Dissostichus eleginoides]
MDLVIRLREQMKSRSTYDKVFQKVWGASGGWAVIMCPCGIVNAVKFNVRAESPRDYADMLLSFKHMPNVAIYDFARGLVTHTNLREPEKMPFRPNEGRLTDDTPANLLSAAKSALTINLPWLKFKKEPADTNGHPTTGSADHYVLYDTFHEANTKDPKDCLRKIGLVPELRGLINSQTAEQLFSKMRKNNYFLNMMSPGSHVFLMRCTIHHHNIQRNEKTLTELWKISSEEIALDPTGKTVMASALFPSGTSTPAHPKVHHFQQKDADQREALIIPLGVAQQIIAGSWTEKTALDFEGLPKQTHGNDCGVFMIMHDMSLLRRWWCVILVENFGLEGYGKKFAHYSEEGRATLSDNVPPTFRISRKRTHASSTMVSVSLNVSMTLCACFRMGYYS